MADPSALNIRREWVSEVVRVLQLIAGTISIDASSSSAAPLNSYDPCLPQPANAAERLVLRSLVAEVALHIGSRDGAACEMRVDQHLSELITQFQNMLGPFDDRSRRFAPFSRSTRRVPGRLPRDAPPDLADAVGRFIDEHYRARLTVQVIAKAVGRSQSQVRRVFRDAYGLPIHAYLTAVRVRRGLIALTATDIKVEAISMMVGYKSTKDFYRACRQLTGLTPGDIRHQPPGGRLAVSDALTAALGRRSSVELIDSTAVATAHLPVASASLERVPKP